MRSKGANKIKMRGYGIGRKIKINRWKDSLSSFLLLRNDIFFPRIADSTIDSDRYNRAALVITFLYGDGV